MHDIRRRAFLVQDFDRRRSHHVGASLIGGYPHIISAGRSGRKIEGNERLAVGRNRRASTRLGTAHIRRRAGEEIEIIVVFRSAAVLQLGHHLLQISCIAIGGKANALERQFWNRERKCYYATTYGNDNKLRRTVHPSVGTGQLADNMQLVCSVFKSFARKVNIQT